MMKLLQYFFEYANTRTFNCVNFVAHNSFCLLYKNICLMFLLSSSPISQIKKDPVTYGCYVACPEGMRHFLPSANYSILSHKHDGLPLFEFLPNLVILGEDGSEGSPMSSISSQEHLALTPLRLEPSLSIPFSTSS